MAWQIDELNVGAQGRKVCVLVSNTNRQSHVQGPNITAFNYYIKNTGRLVFEKSIILNDLLIGLSLQPGHLTIGQRFGAGYNGSVGQKINLVNKIFKRPFDHTSLHEDNLGHQFGKQIE